MWGQKSLNSRKSKEAVLQSPLRRCLCWQRGSSISLCMYVVEELREMGPWLVEDVGSGQGFCLIWKCFYIEFSPSLPSFTNNLKSFGGQIQYAIHIQTSHTCNLWCMYVWYVFVSVYYFCLLKWPEISDTLIALSVPGPQFFIYEYHSPIKNRSPFREPGQRKYNMSLEHLVVPENKEVLKECWSHIQRTQASWTGLPLASNDSNRLQLIE